MEQLDIKSLYEDELKEKMVSLGEKPFKGKQLYQWLHQKAVMIENCGMPDEKIYESAEEIPEEAGYYTLLIVKEK